MNWENTLKADDPIMGSSQKYSHDYWRKNIRGRWLKEKGADDFLEKMIKGGRKGYRKVGPLKGPQGRYWLVYRVGKR